MKHNLDELENKLEAATNKTYGNCLRLAGIDLTFECTFTY